MEYSKNRVDLTVSVATAQSKSAFLTSDQVSNLHLQCKVCGVKIPVQPNLCGTCSLMRLVQ